MDHRYKRVNWGKGNPRQLTKQPWKDVLKWDAEAAIKGVRLEVFTASLADVFDDEVPNEWRGRVWEIIDRCRMLNFQLLTKRIENVASMVPWGDHWPDNVWIGTSVENQEYATKRLPILSELPAIVRFISAEPLLDPFRS